MAKITEKWCPRCRETLPVSCFSISKGRGDGFAGWCKGCTASKMREIYAKNKARWEEENAGDQ